MLIRKTRRDAMHELISDVTIKTASSACGSRRNFCGGDGPARLFGRCRIKRWPGQK